jgi:hypothetical protein
MLSVHTTSDYTKYNALGRPLKESSENKTFLYFCPGKSWLLRALINVFEPLQAVFHLFAQGIAGRVERRRDETSH